MSPRPLVAAIIAVGVLALVAVAAGCRRTDDAPHDRRGGASAAGAASAADGASAGAPLTCRTLQTCSDACADAACAAACARRLTAAARPAYDALQACVGPACADADAGAAPCRAPASFGCKMCVLSRCAAQAATCMRN